MINAHAHATTTVTTPSINNIRQGETFDFEIEVSGDDAGGFTSTMDVLQYPGDTPAISRALTKEGNVFKGTLTSAETDALAVGQWFIHITTSDSDEDLREPIKLYISEGWV
ncbi:MAG: hypothetical protein O7D95_06195 [Betaproteobacteria bacterium]|nr:hypothetical protein [Betaproteobacteria bacterium]